MCKLIIDNNANTFGLPPSLIIPIAAKSITAIKTHVGDIIDRSQNGAAFVVNFEPLESPNDLPVWRNRRANLINCNKQIWVHVDYMSYRNFYKQKFGDSSLSQYVVDHIMNRRLARIYGYEYVRLIHVSRGANSSSGRGPENESVKYAGGNLPEKERQSVIVYADPSDLVKMLDIKTEGFPLDPVRDAMNMFYP